MQQLDAAFFALSDPTRRAIVARLARGEATVMELAEPFAMSQPAISRHLRVLQDAGLVVKRAEGTRRPCSLAAAGISDIEHWLADLHKVMARNYDRLDDVLASLQSTQPPKGKKR
jgi:DNA-binding transcriptional ArsR family regulator